MKAIVTAILLVALLAGGAGSIREILARVRVEQANATPAAYPAPLPTQPPSGYPPPPAPTEPPTRGACFDWSLPVTTETIGWLSDCMLAIPVGESAPCPPDGSPWREVTRPELNSCGVPMQPTNTPAP